MASPSRRCPRGERIAISLLRWGLWSRRHALRGERLATCLPRCGLGSSRGATRGERMATRLLRRGLGSSPSRPARRGASAARSPSSAPARRAAGSNSEWRPAAGRSGSLRTVQGWRGRRAPTESWRGPPGRADLPVQQAPLADTEARGRSIRRRIRPRALRELLGRGSRWARQVDRGGAGLRAATRGGMPSWGGRLRTSPARRRLRRGSRACAAPSARSGGVGCSC